MKYAALDGITHALRLEKGDDIHQTIQGFCTDRGIVNATVTGLGSVENPRLAHYSMETRKFTDKQLTGIFEVASLTGNVADVDGVPFAHLHVTVSDIDMRPYAGHLVQGVCSATLELTIVSYETHYTKSDDAAIGLKVWDFQAQ